MSSLFLNYSSDSPCPYHRMLCPARFCAPDFPDSPITCMAGKTPIGHDVYGATGLLSMESYFEVSQWLRHGAKFLWSVDDDWLSIPDWNPAKPADPAMGSWWLAARLADWILCSTPHLASTFPADLRGKTLVAPNLLDLGQYPDLGHPDDDGGPIRVLWSGSTTHLRDTEAVSEAIDTLLDRWGDRKAMFIFFGQPPPQVLLRKYLHRGVAWQKTVPFLQYWQVVNSFRPHVVLAPLDDCEFNKSKSNLRVLEGWALGAAVVASPVGEYGHAISHGHTGLFARSTKDWIDALDRLVHDADLRRNLAKAGRHEVTTRWDWNRWECRRLWHRALAPILGAEAVRPAASEAA